MGSALAHSFTERETARRSFSAVLEIQLIWHHARRSGSTLGRLRQMARPDLRRLSLTIPGQTVETKHQSMTHWRQLIAK